MQPPDEEKIVLTGGRSTPGVVRVGQTVRRPVKSDADVMHALLGHFERCGFNGAPRFLGIDARDRAIPSDIEGFAPPHNGFRLSKDGVRAGARLVCQVHDLTAGTTFAAGSEVACHPNLSQPTFIFRNMIPVAIIDWDGTRPGTRLANFGDVLWAFVHPSMYGEGEPAAQMLRLAAEAYGWSGGGLVDAMLTVVRHFQTVVTGDPAAEAWRQGELGYAVPAALGAAMARPSDRVITVSGDGGFGYAIGKLATQAQHGLRTINLILNNGTLAWLAMWQQVFFAGLRQSVDLVNASGGRDFAVVGGGLGLKGVRVDPGATPIHNYHRRLDEGTAYPRPGTVYPLTPGRGRPDVRRSR